MHNSYYLQVIMFILLKKHTERMSVKDMVCCYTVNARRGIIGAVLHECPERRWKKCIMQENDGLCVVMNM